MSFPSSSVVCHAITYKLVKYLLKIKLMAFQIIKNKVVQNLRLFLFNFSLLHDSHGSHPGKHGSLARILGRPVPFATQPGISGIFGRIRLSSLPSPPPLRQGNCLISAAQSVCPYRKVSLPWSTLPVGDGHGRVFDQYTLCFYWHYFCWLSGF